MSCRLQLVVLTVSQLLNVSHTCHFLHSMQVGKLTRTRADILLKLTSDLPATTNKLLGLRDLFPDINVSLLVSRWPYLVGTW